jgi:hypothetical protein
VSDELEPADPTAWILDAIIDSKEWRSWEDIISSLVDFHSNDIESAAEALSDKMKKMMKVSYRHHGDLDWWISAFTDGGLRRVEWPRLSLALINIVRPGAYTE